MLEGAEPQSIALPPPRETEARREVFYVSMLGAPSSCRVILEHESTRVGDNPGLWGFC